MQALHAVISGCSNTDKIVHKKDNLDHDNFWVASLWKILHLHA